MNEATFESHLGSSLDRVFPTISKTRIETQKTFSLKFGHAVLHLGRGATAYAKGRSDIIVSVDGTATVLFELKRPDLSLTDDDIAQGISYARLHEPMIPIVVVTNGAETRIYSSYDQSEIGDNSLDEQRIVKIIASSAKQAQTARAETIRSLLEGSPDAWAGALRSRTNESLAELQGSIEDLTRPLCSEFRFPRRATPVLGGGFASGERSLALVGPPLSGKTNVIAEFCARSKEFRTAPLYIDCIDSQDLLFEIANALSETFGVLIQSDAVMHWLRVGVGDLQEGRPRLILVLDSLHPDESASLVKQAINLLRNAGPNLGLLLAMTETGYEGIRTNPGRTTLSKLGRDTKIVRLGSLDDDEIDAAATNLFYETSLRIPLGSQFELPMHEVRILRLLIAMNRGSSDIPEGQYMSLPSIVPSQVLKELWKTTAANTELRADLLALAVAYLTEIEGNRSAKLTLASIGIGSMELANVESTVSSAAFERLLRRGYIKRFALDDEMLIVPTNPELLSAALPTVIRPKIVETARTQGHEAAAEQLLRVTRDVALGDRVAAIILEQLMEEDVELLSSIVSSLMSEEPKVETIREGNFLVLLPNGQPAPMKLVDNSIVITMSDGQDVAIPIPEDEGFGKITSNLHPWNILSHLAYIPIRFEAAQGEGWLGTTIMDRIGRFRGTLKNFGAATVTEQNSTYEHSLPGYGNVPCPSRGIVEPITYAMTVGFVHFEDAMVLLAEHAIEDADAALLLRLQIAADSLEGIVDTVVRDRVQKVSKLISTVLVDVLNAIHGDEVSD